MVTDRLEKPATRYPVGHRVCAVSHRYPDLYNIDTAQTLLVRRQPLPFTSFSRPFTDVALLRCVRPVALATDYWYVGTADRYEIEVRSMEGRLRRIIRRAIPNRPISAELAHETQQRMLEMLEGMGGRIEDDAPLPETMPAYGAFRIDALGHLWVQEYRLSDEQPEWAVFDAERRFLGNVEVPANGRITDTGSDYVLGIWYDELDTERVQAYELRKSSQ